jgi:hypothetical protein
MERLDEAAEAFVARMIAAQPGWSVQRMPIGHPGSDLMAIRDRDSVRRRVSVKSRRSGDFQVGIDFTTYPRMWLCWLTPPGEATTRAAGRRTWSGRLRRPRWRPTAAACGCSPIQAPQAAARPSSHPRCWKRWGPGTPGRCWTPPMRPGPHRPSRGERGPGPRHRSPARRPTATLPPSRRGSGRRRAARTGGRTCPAAQARPAAGWRPIGAPTSPGRTPDLQARNDDPR